MSIYQQLVPEKQPIFSPNIGPCVQLTMPSYRYCIVLTNSSWVFQTAMPVPWCSERRCTFIPDVADRGLKVRQLWDLSIFLMLVLKQESQILHVCIKCICCIWCVLYTNFCMNLNISFFAHNCFGRNDGT